MAGVHGLFGKGIMFEEALHIPLMIQLPRQSTAKKSTYTASTVDFLPTLLDYAGCEPYASAEGSSLRPHIEGHTDNENTITFSEYHNFCATSADWKLFTDGRTLTPSALYHIKDDRYELHNRLDDPICADIQQHLTHELTNWYKNIVGEMQL